MVICNSVSSDFTTLRLFKAIVNIVIILFTCLPIDDSVNMPLIKPESYCLNISYSRKLCSRLLLDAIPVCHSFDISVRFCFWTYNNDYQLYQRISKLNKGISGQVIVAANYVSKSLNINCGSLKH